MSLPNDIGRVRAVADKLNASERQLLLGECSGWGSWMFEAGEFMASLGLATCRDGSIQFDTPLAAAVIAYLRDSAAPSGDRP